MMAKTPYPRTDSELLRRIERSAGSARDTSSWCASWAGRRRERRLLLEQLARMTARGDLIKTETEQWALPSAAPEKTARAAKVQKRRRVWAHCPGIARWYRLRAERDRLMAGRLDLHRDGYGFVRPNGSDSREDDLFILR